MTTNAAAAEQLRAIADLLDVLGERFKPEAYRRAARTIETLAEDLGAVARRDELRGLPGVGEAIAEKIREYLANGTIPYYEKLRREVPAGVVELLKLPGLGPKTARRFWLELGIDGAESLRAAIAAGRLEGVAGFGERKIELLRQALVPAALAAPGRLPLDAVYPLARRLLDGLRQNAPVDRAEIAGSFRRGRETVGDLDLLATSTAPERVFDAFQGLPEVREVKLRGPTKATAVLVGGLQADLRVVGPEEFGAALQYFTGSKDHNVQLRSLARELGLKVNEYGVFRGEARIAGRTEEEVYAALGVGWIPPELREGRDEIERARRLALPPLVAASDLAGELHVHLPEEARPAEAERLLSDARFRRLRYVAIVVRGRRSDGTTWELEPATRDALASAPPTGPRTLLADEVPWNEVGPDAARAPTAYRVLRPVGPPPASRTPPPGGPVLLLGHLPAAGESGSRAAELELARRWRTPIEIGPGPERLDPTAGRGAREAGILLGVPTGLGQPPDDPIAPVALAFARRAGAGPDGVANARDPPVGPTRGAKGGRRSP